MKTAFVPLSAAALALGICSLHAQTVNIWPGVAPGSERWTHKERSVENTPIGTVIFNVVTPTLTAYLPERTKATGTSVIIAPGGAFVALAVELEGSTLARWLQERGIAAFVLKYRIVEKLQEGIPAMNALISAGHKPEVHIFSTGGHGFGLRKQGTSSDHWIEDFYNWLAVQGLTRR